MGSGQGQSRSCHHLGRPVGLGGDVYPAADDDAHRGAGLRLLRGIVQGRALPSAGGAARRRGWNTSILLYPLSIVLSSYVAVGITRGLLDVVGRALRPERLIKVPAMSWAQMVALQVILFIGLTLGYILFLIPGIILTLGMTVAGIVLVDEDTDALQAMATSWAMMGGAKLQMFKINACMSILTFGGMLLFAFVGMIPVIMVWALVPVVVYEQLRQSRRLPRARPSRSLTRTSRAEGSVP